MKKRYLILAVLCLLSIIIYLDRTAISVAEHSITSDLNLSEKQFGWILAAFSIAYGIFQIPAGFLGDRYGVKKVLMWIVLWWSLFTIGTGFAAGFLSLFIVRFLFASGEAGAFPNISIALSKWFPILERGRAQSMVWMFTRLGGTLAPLLIFPIISHWGWRYVFYIFGFIGFLWVFLWKYFFKENPSAMKNISPQEIKEIEENRKIKQGGHHINFKLLFKNKNLWLLLMMYFLYMFSAYFYLSWMPKYLRQGRGFNIKAMGLSSLPFIFGALGCLVGGFLSDYLVNKIGLKWGRRTIGITGLYLAGLCLILCSISTNNNWCILFLSLGLAFKDFTLPVSWAVATDMGGKNAGVISGSMHMFGQIGSTIMSIAFGYLVANGDWNFPILLIGIVVICSGTLWFFIDASKQIEYE